MSENMIWNKAIEEHYILNKRKLLNQYRFLGDSAEDVVHEAYERAIRYYQSFNGEDFDRWFSTIIRNSMRDYRRQEYNMPEEEILDEYDHIGSYCSGFDLSMIREINKEIGLKADNHREVLNLYFNLGYSYKDIAAVTDNTYFNSYRIVSRFKEELLKKYKG
jgi:RNA polymerase sigma factor (sigma-70 family)